MLRTMITSRAALVAALIVATIAGVGGLALGSSGDASAGSKSVPVTVTKSSSDAEKSQALVDAPPLYTPASKGLANATAAQEKTISAAGARGAAATISTNEIPLAPGLNTAQSIDWTKQSGHFGDGSVSEADVRSILEENAFRDWIWFAANNELSDADRALVEQLPSWNEFRRPDVQKWAADHVTTALGADRQAAKEDAATLFPDFDGRPTRTTGW